MSLEALKKNRKDNINKLIAAAEKAGASKQDKEDTSLFWKPKVDEANNGYAVIRFLPAAEGDDLPWVRYWDHGFQGPGGWYIEKSLTSIGQQDPVGILNGKLWATGDEADKETARKQKRRLHYVANILVVSDPAQRECEGKVFYYEFGKKIFDKIMDAMQPQFEDEAQLDPFDPWEGANFKLKIRDVEGYRNYDKSEFDKPSKLADSDAEIEEIYSKVKSLKSFIDPANYKTFDELQAKLDRVLGNNTKKIALAETNDSKFAKSDVREPEQGKVKVEQEPEQDDVDDTMSYFQKLANEA